LVRRIVHAARTWSNCGRMKSGMMVGFNTEFTEGTKVREKHSMERGQRAGTVRISG